MATRCKFLSLATSRPLFCILGLTTVISKLVLLGEFSLSCGTESTVFAKEEANKEINNGPTLSTTGQCGFASVEDVLTNGAYRKLSADCTTQKAVSHMNGMEDSLDKSANNIDDLTGSKTSTEMIHDNSNIVDMKLTSDASNTINNPTTSLENINQSEFGKNQTLTNVTTSTAENTSKPDAENPTNKTVEPFWSCAKYNITEQNVIILKDKNSLIWWLDELNKTMGCAVVLFYAKWCYFSASLAPAYNAVGRAFSGIPILAIDAYTHNGLNTRYGIVGVPTIILFQESRPVARFNRSRTFKNLVEFIHQSTGMDYNKSVEVSQSDYDEGPLPSSPSDEFNFHLFASVCFLFFMFILFLWRLRYLQVFLEYLISLKVVRTMLGTDEREKMD